MRKHVATLAGLALALAFVVLFFSGRYESKPFNVVAMQIGLTPDDLIAMVPRISSQSGATMGTSRRVVYLMACSGVATSATLEGHAMAAANIAEKQGVTPREATKSVLGAIPAPQGIEALRHC